MKPKNWGLPKKNKNIKQVLFLLQNCEKRRKKIRIQKTLFFKFEQKKNNSN